jgi:hypothetical protein
MNAATCRERDAAAPPEPCAEVRVALLYLDVRGRRLHLLNEAARQFHADGLLLLRPEAAPGRLRTPGGDAVGDDELPLRAAARGLPVEADFVVSRPGRPDCHLHWSAAPLRDAGGQVVAVLASVCCVPLAPDWHTLAGLAHDLRTPLQTLRLLSAALGPADLPEAQRADGLSRLSSAAGRALQVSADLLDWCRAPVQGGRRVRADWFALEPFLAGLAREQEPAARRKGVAVTCDLAGARGWEVHTDEVRLGRVLANLLTNAVRYTPATGRVALTAAWQGEEGERCLVLSVADTGAGVSPEEQESIFEPFVRGKAGQGDTSSGGSGLGLAVVDRLVSELGLGREFSSEHGRGSQFRLLVPQRLLRFCPPAAGDHE